MAPQALKLCTMVRFLPYPAARLRFLYPSKRCRPSMLQYEGRLGPPPIGWAGNGLQDLDSQTSTLVSFSGTSGWWFDQSLLMCCVQLEEREWQENVDGIMADFEREHGRRLLYTICFY